MATVQGGISVNEDKTLNFGDYRTKEKIKVKDFDVDGDMYSVKTHDEVTRLEQNGKLLVECVPGASFTGFMVNEAEIACHAFGRGVTNITLELLPDTDYRFFVNNKAIGTMKSTISGKISFSAELSETETAIRIQKL